ncbi:MAG: RelA/SpoT domain-containing protein [Acidimicrobiales bacterium]
MSGNGHSKSAINRAGDLLAGRTGGTPTPEEILAAYEVVDWYRASHTIPLTTANMGLRSVMKTEGCNTRRATQRLKRMNTIIDKLRRYPRMDLARMQDIAGARAVLESLDEVRRVQKRYMANSLQRNGKADKVKDYVTNPKDTGYRSIHLHTSYHQVRIEVQLRTPLQHEWAIMIEVATGITGIDLKSGLGPDELLDAYRHAAAGMALEEVGVTPDESFMAEFTRLTTRAQQWLIADRASQEGTSR